MAEIMSINQIDGIFEESIPNVPVFVTKSRDKGTISMNRLSIYHISNVDGLFADITYITFLDSVVAYDEVSESKDLFLDIVLGLS